MATFTSPALGTPAASQRNAGQAVTVYSEVALAVTPLTGDIFQMINVPAGARVIGWGLGSDDIDTGAGVTLSLGDGADVDRYVVASTIGQTGGVPVDAMLKTGYGFIYTTADTVDIQITVQPGTFAAGTLRCHITYVSTTTAS